MPTLRSGKFWQGIFLASSLSRQNDIAMDLFLKQRHVYTDFHSINKYLLHSRHCSKYWAYSYEQNRWDSSPSGSLHFCEKRQKMNKITNIYDVRWHKGYGKKIEWECSGINMYTRVCLLCGDMKTYINLHTFLNAKTCPGHSMATARRKAHAHRWCWHHSAYNKKLSNESKALFWSE